MTGTTTRANFSALTPLTFLDRSASVFPDRTAIVHGDRTYSYAEFRAAAERFARAIRAATAPGDRVAFLTPNIPELLIAHFAVPLAGAILVAINTRLAPKEIETILQHSGAALVFVDAELVAKVSTGDSEWSEAPRVVVIANPAAPAPAGTDAGSMQDLEQFLAAAESPADDDRSDLSWDVEDENAVISINYTSGTTGDPKGVMYTHRGAYLNALGEVYHNVFNQHSVYLWTLPMFHCNGWCTPWAVTAASATHICLRGVRADTVWDAIDRYRVTNLCGAPTVCALIADASQAHPLEWPLRVTTAGARRRRP